MCGFVGLIGVERAAPAISIGLQAVQHRGQDACGIGTLEHGRVHLYKDLGSVAGTFTEPVLKGLIGRGGIGHVRYPTVGGGSREDAQPFHTRRPGVVMAHNGNVTNLPELEAWLGARGIRVQSGCDVEPILLVFAESLSSRRAGREVEGPLGERRSAAPKRGRARRARRGPAQEAGRREGREGEGREAACRAEEARREAGQAARERDAGPWWSARRRRVSPRG